MTRIICTGMVAFDRIFEVDAIPAEPIKITARAYREHGGGMAATAAVAVAALGGEAIYWGRVGDDATGTTLMAKLRSLGVNCDDLVPRRGAVTPNAAVLVDPQGERLLVVHPGTGLGDGAQWLPLARVASTAAVHGDFRWPAGSEALFVEARRLGKPRILDADAGDAQAVRRLLPLVDHAIFSTRGLLGFTGSDDPEAALRRVRPQVAGVVAVTLGAGGCLWDDGTAVHREPAFVVQARDTTGAGDTFHGAYALAIGEGRRPADAIRFASAAAAQKCARGNGWDGMPSRADVERQLQG